MAKLFNLKILTPEREFFDGDVEALTLCAPDGKVTVLADHVPFVMPVVAGSIRIKKDAVWEESVNTEGFMEVHHQGVLVFVQTCEHPDEVDMHRVEDESRRAEELLRQKQSVSEHKQLEIAIARAMADLKLKKPME